MMDSETFLKLDALHRCGYRPGSFEKRFVQDMSALGPYDLLTARQIKTVDSLYWHYRRQINLIRSNHPTVNYPLAVQPEYDALMIEAFTTRKQTHKQIAAVDKKAAAAMEKLNTWNRKVKGQ